MPKVSVILPIYNVEKYLRKCLDSVINQTLKDIEIICINDCSADNCENIILEYAKKDGRIKIINNENTKAIYLVGSSINNEKNYGIGFSRNIGINESSGEYISFIDADDYIEKDYIEILYNTAIKNKADIVFTNNINIVRDKIIKPYYHNRINIWKKKFKENETWKEGISDFNVNTPEKENTPEYPLVSTVNKIFKKDFIEKNNLKFQNYIVSEDTEFFYKYLLYSPKKFYNNEAKYYYVQRKSSLTHSIEKDNQMITDALSVFKNIFNIYKEKKIELLKDANYYNFNSFLFVFNNYKAQRRNEKMNFIKNVMI